MRDIITLLKSTVNKLMAYPVAPIKSNIKKHVVAIYLFGSFAEGAGKTDSDIDLAFVFNERFYKTDPFVALQQAELLSIKISEKIKKPIDVALINGCSLSFAYHILKKGICIYEKNPAKRILYEVTLDSKYTDFKLFIEELRESKKEKLIGRN